LLSPLGISLHVHHSPDDIHQVPAFAQTSARRLQPLLKTMVAAIHTDTFHSAEAICNVATLHPALCLLDSLGTFCVNCLLCIGIDVLSFLKGGSTCMYIASHPPAPLL